MAGKVTAVLFNGDPGFPLTTETLIRMDRNWGERRGRRIRTDDLVR